MSPKPQDRSTTARVIRRTRPRVATRRSAVIALVFILLTAAAAACTSRGNPTGSLDVARKAGNAVVVEGWAFDPETSGNVLIEVREGSTVLASKRTGTPLRNDVAAAYPGQTTNAVGFSITTPALSAGSHQICVWARNRGVGTGDTNLGCRPFSWSFDSVAILGDSLAVGVDSPLRQRISTRWPGTSVVTRAESGSPLSYARDGINLYKSSTDVLVVSSGVNSLLNANVTSELTTTLDASAGAACVVWPTVSERIYDSAQWATAARAFNARLRADAATRPWIRVADWAPVVTANTSYTGSDGLHHTAAGNAAFADLLATTIATC